MCVCENLWQVRKLGSEAEEERVSESVRECERERECEE